jgi:hypothetical protein
MKSGVDFWFMIYPGELWPHTCFKPLMFGISFPMRKEEPWLVRRGEQVVEYGRRLQALSKISHVELGDYLRKLWNNPWGLP